MIFFFFFYFTSAFLQASARASSTAPPQNAPQLRPRTPHPRAADHVFPPPAARAENRMVGIPLCSFLLLSHCQICEAAVHDGHPPLLLFLLSAPGVHQQGAGNRDRGPLPSVRAPALPPAPLSPSPQTAPLPHPLHGEYHWHTLALMAGEGLMSWGVRGVLFKVWFQDQWCLQH